MNTAGILGSLLQSGMRGAGGPGQRRLDSATSGGGLLDILGGAGGGGSLGSMLAGSGGGGGILDQVRSAIQQNPQLAAGGIGALAGMLMGRGQPMGGIMGGAALGTLGMIAAKALRAERGQQASPGASPPPAAAPVEVTEDMALLMIRSMIAAAKADGAIDQSELEKIMGKLEENGLGEEERRWVLDEMVKPVDLEGLARQVRDRETAAQVYAAAMLAVEVDTPEEKAHLRRLATLLGLTPDVVQSLHDQLDAGAPDKSPFSS